MTATGHSSEVEGICCDVGGNQRGDQWRDVLIFFFFFFLTLYGDTPSGSWVPNGVGVSIFKSYSVAGMGGR